MITMNEQVVAVINDVVYSVSLVFHSDRFSVMLGIS